ncbi:DDB1- and CUL4-associated factor 5-like [Oscarella lobularis]|uniref:DDB1- and CUL4-associated factor 5-like n=1 Tax=Oscarella lobularis TaxID=121494 RepID=UPI0033139C96
MWLRHECETGRRDVRRSYVSSKMHGAAGRHLPSLTMRGHCGCVNALEFSKNDGGQWIVSGGDDTRVLVWNANRIAAGVVEANSLKTRHASNIFTVQFDNESRCVYSGGNDATVLCHDLGRQEAMDVFPHAEPVYSLSVDPHHSCIFSSAGQDGKVLLWDRRASSEGSCTRLMQSSHSFHSVAFHPVEPRFIATANVWDGVRLHDIRQPRKCYIHYGVRQKAMSVAFNRSGTELFVLRRRAPPLLYSVYDASDDGCQFLHNGYANACTMKSGCFAGENDEYVVSGSDDFNVYMWRIPSSRETRGSVQSSAQFVLPGHRSIVNQVRFNSRTMVLLTSGVEKIIKMWSLFPSSSFEEESVPRQRRRLFTSLDHVDIMLSLGASTGGRSTAEDERMLEFFDSLIEQDHAPSDTDTDSGSSSSGTTTDDGVANDSDDSSSDDGRGC